MQRCQKYIISVKQILSLESEYHLNEHQSRYISDVTPPCKHETGDKYTCCLVVLLETDIVWTLMSKNLQGRMFRTPVESS